jgi:hypothetical protein
VFGDKEVSEGRFVFDVIVLCYYFPEQKNKQYQWTLDQLKTALGKIS